MFKRANKVTALLVAAASIMSIVPAMAAEKLSTKDGTVKQGIAFEDGQYGYFGYRTDDDETGIWYNKGGEDKDSAIEDLDEYEYTNTSKYGEKYAYAFNDGKNDDEYLIDLTTGKVLEDETISEKRESAQSKLQAGLRKADRFNDRTNDNDKFDVADKDFKQVLTGQFGEVWYRYTTDAAIKFEDKVNETTTSAAVVLTNDAGKYIDISITANMRVYSTKKQRAVNIENYDKQYSDNGLVVRLEKAQVLTQDKDNFYVLAQVKVIDLADSNRESTQYFIQTISKARGSSQVDGAYVPKDVTSYQLDAKAIYDNGDAEDAYKAIMTSDKDYLHVNNQYAVKDSVLYVTKIGYGTVDNVQVVKLKLGKVKTDTVQSVNTKYTKIEDVDTNLVTKDDDSDHDIVETTVQPKADAVYDNEVTGSLTAEDGTVFAERKLVSTVSIDTEGNTWALDTGKVYKFDGSEWKLMYTVDRNSDSLDVYNDGNLIVYEADGGVYTTVQEGKKTTIDDALNIDPTIGQTTGAAAKVGWDQLADGTWNFYDVSGVKQANFWANDNGTWYWIKADGIMAANEWSQVNGVWYFLNTSGAMARGWTQVNGTWYYLNSTSGAMATGWLNDNGTWYYLTGSGAMASNTTVDGYVLGASGAWIQ